MIDKRTGLMKEFTKSQFFGLQKLFSYESGEVNGIYPPQLHDKVAKNLIERGFVKKVEIKDGLFTFICHELTEKGRKFIKQINKKM